MDKTRSDSIAGGASGQPHSDEVRRRAAEAESQTLHLRWDQRFQLTQERMKVEPCRKQGGSPSDSIARDLRILTETADQHLKQAQTETENKEKTNRASGGRIRFPQYAQGQGSGLSDVEGSPRDRMGSLWENALPGSSRGQPKSRQASSVGHPNSYHNTEDDEGSLLLWVQQRDGLRERLRRQERERRQQENDEVRQWFEKHRQRQEDEARRKADRKGRRVKPSAVSWVASVSTKLLQSGTVLSGV